MTKRLGFIKADKIRKTKEYLKLFKEGQQYYYRAIKIYILPRPNCQNNRLGVIVSRKVKGAVIRNRYKRLVREFFRLNQAKFKNKVELVIIITGKIEPVDYDIIKKRIIILLNKINLYSKEEKELK